MTQALKSNARLFPYQITGPNAKDQINQYWNCKLKRIIVPAGRRSYKTETAKRRLVRTALSCHDRQSEWYIDYPTGCNFIAGAPTHAQAMRIFWFDLQELIGKKYIRETNLKDCRISLINGSNIFVFGMDSPERVEGFPVHGVLLDEFANMKEEVWSKHIMPALSATKGFAWFIGVPEGRNHYYQLWLKAKDDPKWGAFHWRSEDCLDPEEVEDAKKALDPLTFEQEYGGSFVNYQGLAYYPFDHEIHVGPCEYNKKENITFCLDFNVSPGIAVIVQEQKMDDFSGTGVIGEVHIPRGSNTKKVVASLINQYREHEGPITIVGDATGGARRTSSDATDWEIVKRMLNYSLNNRIFDRVPKKNPFVRDRINAVNSRLQTTSGEIHLRFDPDRCPETILDFQNTAVNEMGDLETKSGPWSHMSDALGYYIADRFPIHEYESSGLTHWK